MRVDIGSRHIGEGHRTYVVAECGINANGSLWLAKDMVRLARAAGADCVKFQVRTVDKVYSQEYLASPRESPWGATQGMQKRALEFSYADLRSLAECARAEGIDITASAWDTYAVKRTVGALDPPWIKVASAHAAGHSDLLAAYRDTGLPTVMSCGGSTMEQITEAFDILQPDALMVTTSLYPCPDVALNLRRIPAMRDHYRVPVGFSCHSTHPSTVHAAVALGAAMVEVHVTIDRDIYGSDQGASYTFPELDQMIRGIRRVENAMGDGVIEPHEDEAAVMAKLRGVV